MANPLGEDFDYAEAFNTLDLAAVKQDIEDVLTTSQDWWPADFGHYGPFMIRMAWHSAGTYRISDGRGGAGAGQQRFAPLNSWPDNGNLDKARRLLWPVKQKYGQALSWADLIVLTGNVALESMGFETFGFAGGREDVWEPDEDVYWGPETEWLGDERYTGDRELEQPLGAVQMGLIYVNPEGPNGEPDPLASAKDIRETFARMAMNDEETIALIAGGHTFGKAHGAADPDEYVGPEPEGAPLEEQGLGWRQASAPARARTRSRAASRSTWTATPTRWSTSFFDNLFGFEWELTKSPAGAYQWQPVDGGGAGTVPGPEEGSAMRPPTMLTTDLALRLDPDYEPISRRFHEHPDQLADAFARAWFKLTHRDMGPIQRYLGPEVPTETLLWQDPIPEATHELGAEDVTALKAQILDSGLSVSELVKAAWASASTFRGSDKRGGANGARVRLAPQNGWEVNDPEELGRVLQTLEGVQPVVRQAGVAGRPDRARRLRGRRAGGEGRRRRGRRRVHAGSRRRVGGADGRRLVRPAGARRGRLSQPPQRRSPPAGGVPPDRPGEPADAERTGDDRPRGRPARPGRERGRLLAGRPHSTPGSLTNDFFVNLLDLGTTWTASGDEFEGRDAAGELRWTGSRVDLVFGSNSELRALAEVYASDDAREKFVRDFVAAWVKVMNLDRYDLG